MRVLGDHETNILEMIIEIYIYIYIYTLDKTDKIPFFHSIVKYIYIMYIF